MDTGQRQEQGLSSICSPSCLNAMVEDLDEESSNSGKELRRSDCWLMRRTTTPEEAEAGLKIVCINDEQGLYRGCPSGTTSSKIRESR